MTSPKPELKTAALFQPVTLEELKSALDLGMSVTIQDQDLVRNLRSATSLVESASNRILAHSVWTWVPHSMAYRQPLPVYNVTKVNSVQYDDGTGLQSFADFTLDTSRVVPELVGEWPTPDPLAVQPFVVEYEAGWASNELVPRQLKDQIIAVAQELWDPSGDDDLGQINRALQRRNVAAYL